MNRLSVLIISLLAWQWVSAQNEDDALRYSFTLIGGSARNVGTAGAFSAVGGDYSIVSSNPAGLGRFKKHNFSFTQAYEMPYVVSDYYGNKKSSFTGAYKISNLSYIKAYNLDPDKFHNWYGVQMGLGYNRILSFHESMDYEGVQDTSILHSFIKMANGTTPDNIYSAFPFDAGLAYDTYALDPGPGNTYTTDFTSGTTTHHRTIHRKGGMGEYSFTLSGNYNNKLLVGGTFNITRVKYHEQFEHREVFSDSALWLQDIRYVYDLAIEGAGYGARLGLIYMPIDNIRFGFSVQSPTLFKLSDVWSATMYTNTDSGLKYVSDENIPVGNFRYRVQTPLRANFSFGYIFKKNASIGLDVEMVDYSGAILSTSKFSETPYLFLAENAQIENIYRTTCNYKVGGEVRLKSQVYVRAGYAQYGSPFKPEKNISNDPVRIFTSGIGYNFGIFYVDGAVLVQQKKSQYYAYDPVMSGSHVSFNHYNTSLLVTLGFRFE